MMHESKIEELKGILGPLFEEQAVKLEGLRLPDDAQMVRLLAADEGFMRLFIQGDSSLNATSTAYRMAREQRIPGECVSKVMASMRRIAREKAGVWLP
jgi:hypothetical protein